MVIFWALQREDRDFYAVRLASSSVGGGEVKSMYFEIGSPYLIFGIETRLDVVKERRGLIWRELKVLIRTNLGIKSLKAIAGADGAT
jgi:hypothetical protein